MRNITNNDEMLLQLQSGRERKSPVLQQLKVIKFETEKNETLETQIGVITWNVEQHYRLDFYLSAYICSCIISESLCKSHFSRGKLSNY